MDDAGVEVGSSAPLGENVSEDVTLPIKWDASDKTEDLAEVIGVPCKKAVALVVYAG